MNFFSIKNLLMVSGIMSVAVLAIEPKVRISSEPVYVAGSCLNMGYEKGERDEVPVHKVCLSSFYMDQHEVTQMEYMGTMGNNPSKFQTCGFQCPVEQVNWLEASEYCKRQGKRLPTEAEWEFAARGGKLSKNYHFIGDNRVDSTAWYASSAQGSPKPVCEKHANELGLCDMGGNVWEWVDDWYAEYSALEQKNPRVPDPVHTGDTMNYKVNRGGSFYGDADLTRPAYRGWDAQDSRRNNVGFRCVRDSVVSK